MVCRAWPVIALVWLESTMPTIGDSENGRDCNTFELFEARHHSPSILATSIAAGIAARITTIPF
jgi:hypothetical protein